MLFLKTLGPNGTRITVVSWKAGSRQGRSPYFEVLGFWRLLGQKGGSKDPFLKIMKIRNGTQTQLFRKVRRWDPLKTVPRKFDEKTIGKYIVLDGPKPLKSIEKQALFLILGHSKKRWQNDTKGNLKSHVFGSKMATLASPVRLIVGFLMFCCDAKKSSFLDAFPMHQKIEKSSLGAPKGRTKSSRGIAGGVIFSQEGPRGRLARAD